MKGVKVTVCGLQCVDLNLDSIKILGTHFSCYKKLKEERNFCITMGNIQRVLLLWKLHNLTLEVEIFKIIFFFKTLSLSKLIFKIFVLSIPYHIITEMKKMQKHFLWENFTPKLKHDTLCNK